MFITPPTEFCDEEKPVFNQVLKTGNSKSIIERKKSSKSSGKNAKNARIFAKKGQEIETSVDDFCSNNFFEHYDVPRILKKPVFPVLNVQNPVLNSSNPPEAEIYVNLLAEDFESLDEKFEFLRSSKRLFEFFRILRTMKPFRRFNREKNGSFRSKILDPFEKLEKEFGLDEDFRDFSHRFAIFFKKNKNEMSSQPAALTLIDFKIGFFFFQIKSFALDLLN